jgi:L-2-hydroxyglutarate oxidase LhgO
MVDQVDAVVVGAGVVGLAVARELVLRGEEVVLLEAGPAIGLEISSRNSQVVHAGIYYPTGSAKARLCVAGKALLYAYCESRGVQHKRLGKLIVASDAREETTLRSYQAQAVANGVADLRWLSARKAQALEPAIQCSAALLSPSTGIVDSHELMTALLADLEAAGGLLALNSPVTGGRILPAGIEIQVGTDQTVVLRCRRLVNSAGLEAQRVASLLQGFKPQHLPPRHLAIGHYYALAGRSPFSRLVYPVAQQGGLGIHVTLDLAGQARFGPDVRWLEALDYDFDDSRRAAFVEAIRRYYPAIRAGDLLPGYTGIRPKLAGAGEPAADFLLQGPAQHGVAGLVNLFGIESPGLTASLAIAREAAGMLGVGHH